MSLKSAGLLAAAVLLVPGAALAAHGKVGLWESSTSITIPGVSPQLHKATYCMTAADVKSDAPPTDKSSGCTYKNVSVQGHTFSADMVCTGQFQATGHLTSTFDSDTHYTSTISMAGDGFNMTNHIEGKWLKAACAGATQ
jgi:hypothetical protein